MKHKLLKMMLLLSAFIAGSSVWAEDVTLAAGTNGSACTVNGKDGIKVGTSKAGGTMTITVPANSTKLTLHAAAWKGVSNLSVGITGATTDPNSITLTADDGISNNSPFTLSGNEDNFVHEITLSNITTETTLTLSADKRFVVWGASAVVSGGSDDTKVATFSYEDYKGEGTLNYGSEYTMIKTDVRITHNMFYCSDTYPQAFFYGYGGVTDGLITITPSNGATITKIEFTTPETDHNGYQDGGTITPSIGTVSANNEDKTKATTTTWTGSVSSQFTITNTKTILWSKIVVTYTGGLPQCATPVISGETPFVTYSTVTITCATEGASIQYSTSTDGSTYTDYQPYTKPFQVSQTTTVKAQATKEHMVPSKEAYKGFVQQEVAYNIKYFISDRALSGTLEFIRLEDALVTYKNGNTAYLEDAYGAIVLYKCVGDDLAAGDKINGYMHVTGYTVYNNLPEITGYELVEGYVKSAEPEVTPTVMTLEQLLGDPAASPYDMYLSKYIKIENATVTSAFTSKNCEIEQGGYTIVLRDQNSTPTLTSTVGDNVTVTGHVAIFNTTKQISVYEQSQIVVSAAPAVPTITVTPSSLTGFTYVEGNGPSAAQTITVSGTNLTADITLDTTTDKYEMSLNEASGYTNNLTLTPSAGEVAATTIYVRLKADMPVNASYNGDIVITSTDATTKYVNLSGSVTEPKADYATLPFKWAGGASADFEALNGVTTNGLGSDYAAGNAPYLMKFDSDGDYIQVKTDNQPGNVTIGVKMIGGANTSTIKVQESTDGTSFTDVEDLTISGKQNDVLELKTTKAFAATSRYVRLTFTKGSNVGVGPITITKATASTDPSIAVSPASVDALAAGDNGTLAISYANLTIKDMSDFGVQFYDADNNELNGSDEPKWLEVLVAEDGSDYVVSYVVDANDGAARTAYCKIFAMGEKDFVYSNLITITQAAYVVDYATLPFEFDGVKADIATTSGLTQEGLGSDYSSSPKLRFDNTGDNLVLKINEVPGTLSFDIKGNGFADGTFTVQTSADGKSYTDFATYTELGATETKELELATTVRYIKWVYTEKVTGNVALGNIKLTKGVLPEFTWNLSVNSSIAWSEDQVTWGSYYATMVADKAGSSVTDISSQLGTYSGAYSRFWEKTKLTITPAKGYTIMSVEFLTKQTYHANYLKESTWTNATASADGTTVTVKPVDGTQPFFATILQNTDVETVKVIFSKDVTIDGCTTYVTIANTKFPSGVNAYIVSSVVADKINLTKVTAVPEETAVILQGKGTFATSIVDAADCDDVSANLLQPSMGTQKGDGSTIYALSDKEKHGLGFYLVDSSVTIPAGKAYLVISSSSIKEFYGFADDATGIKTIGNEQMTIDNAAIYNLAGQRLQKMQKGINIVNGKKVLK